MSARDGRENDERPFEKEKEENSAEHRPGQSADSKVLGIGASDAEELGKVKSAGDRASQANGEFLDENSQRSASQTGYERKYEGRLRIVLRDQRRDELPRRDEAKRGDKKPEEATPRE